MMGEDRAILRDTWDGRVPVCFTLAQEEVASEKPDPVYLMVPRHSYFPLVTEKVSKHLALYAEKDKVGEMWFESDGQPLKWHYPVGVLYDLYANLHSHLPWKIVVHFQDFPEDELLHCPCRDAVESHFMSTLKEADALKHRSIIINGMQKRDHKQMWMGLVNDKFDQFWVINRKLMESTGEDAFKYIPFRIYQPQSDVLVTQKLFKPQSEEGHQHTLADLLKCAVPNLGGDKTQMVLIQGIEVPRDTPILWLSEHLSHPDNFLHICITSPKSQDPSEQW